MSDHVMSQLAGVDHPPYLSVELIDGVAHARNRCLECHTPLTKPISLIGTIHGEEPEEIDDGGR